MGKRGELRVSNICVWIRVGTAAGAAGAEGRVATRARTSTMSATAKPTPTLRSQKWRVPAAPARVPFVVLDKRIQRPVFLGHSCTETTRSAQMTVI
jgi:hypothetical protein